MGVFAVFFDPFFHHLSALGEGWVVLLECFYELLVYLVIDSREVVCKGVEELIAGFVD